MGKGGDSVGKGGDDQGSRYPSCFSLGKSGYGVEKGGDDHDTPDFQACEIVGMTLGRVGMIKIPQLFKHGEDWGWGWEGWG